MTELSFAADGTFGPLQTLTPAPANEPVVMSLSGGRAIALWGQRRGIGAALAPPNGRFEETDAPTGPPPASPPTKA